MQKVKDSDLTLYEEIEEIKKRRARQKEKRATCPTCPTQEALTLCNNFDNFKSPYKSDTSQGRLVPVPIIVQEPALKQDPVPPMPVIVPDAELISRSLQYLDGIDEDLTGWTLWKRIEQDKEHRFARDPAGVIRWERWYSERLTLAAGTDQGQ